MQPKQFRVPTAATSTYAKKLLFILVPLLVFASFIGLFVAHSSADEGKGDYTSLYISIPFTIVIVIYSAYNGLKKTKQQLGSYVLAFYANSIERQQAGTPTIHLYNSEIKEIVRIQDGFFYIRAMDSTDSIFVPKSNERQNEVHELLENIMPLSSKRTYSLLTKYGKVLVFVMLGFMGLVYYSTNKFVVTVVGLLLLAYLGWALNEGRRSKSIDSRTKKGLVWLIIVILSLVFKIVNVWMN